MAAVDRLFEGELAFRVEGRYGYNCPCCSKRMVRPRRKNELNRRRRDRKVVAHDFGHFGRWIYVCQSCNNDKGQLNFASWHRRLVALEDPRSDMVAQLVRLIGELSK